MIKPKLILVGLLVFFISLTSIMAWYVYDQNKEINLEVGKFEMVIDLTLVNSDTGLNLSKDEVLTRFYDPVKKLIGLHGSSGSEDNSLLNLVVDLQIKAEIKGFFRIKIKDQWKKIRTYKSDGSSREEVISFSGTEFTQFILLNPADYRVDRKTNYIYYIKPISKGETLLQFIHGGKLQPVKDNEIFSEECFIDLNFEMEIVQMNRYQEKFGITSFDDLSPL